jgi:hypothetical protein
MEMNMKITINNIECYKIPIKNDTKDIGIVIVKSDDEWKVGYAEFEENTIEVKEDFVFDHISQAQQFISERVEESNGNKIVLQLSRDSDVLKEQYREFISNDKLEKTNNVKSKFRSKRKP